MAVSNDLNRRWDAALFGDSFIDHVFTGFPSWPQPGEEVFANHYVREAGGGAVNTACGLARLGRKTAFLGIAGREDGDWLVRRVGECGVNTSGIRRGDAPTGLTVSVSSCADRAFFTYLGVNAELDGMLRDPSVLESLAQARHVHFGFAPEVEAGVNAFERLRAAGCSISLDVGWHPEWLRNPSSLEVIRRATLFFPNEHEAEAITGVKDPLAMLEFFERNGVAAVAIKLGKKGAVMHQAGVIYECAAFQADAVDTTGAGDAFDAGFIHARLDNEPLQRCLELACLCGALSTRAAGALSGLPTREELEARWAK